MNRKIRIGRSSQELLQILLQCLEDLHNGRYLIRR